MTDNSKKQSPPYATWRSFVNFANGLRDSSIPSRIDRSVFGNISGGAAYSILAALKYLKLIDEVGTPSPLLRQLVEASDDERKPLIAQMLKEGYPALWSGAIDLETATAGQFDEHIRNNYDMKGSTLDKVAAFFLAAAEDAGVPISVHLKNRKPVAPSLASKKPRKTRPQTDNKQSLVPPKGTPQERTPAEMLLDIIDMADMTDPEQDAVWTLIRYLKKKEANQ